MSRTRSWGQAFLPEICELQIGKTPSRSNPRYWNGTNPWVTIADLTKKQLKSTSEYITDDAVKECNCKRIPAGTLLMSFKLSIGKLGTSEVPLYTNEAIVALPIIDNSKLDQRFLFHALQAQDFSILGDKAVKGRTLNLNKLCSIKLPLPPLPEQKRIAAILDSADAIRQKRKAAIAKLDELAQSVFLEMFGDPVKNEKGWESELIGNLTDLYNGFPFKPSDWLESDANGAIPIIRIQNLNNPDASFNYTLKNIPDKHRAQHNDLLFSWSGSIGTSFGPHIWKGGHGYINQHIFRVDHSAKVERVYFYWALKNIVHLVEEKAHGGVGLVHITKGELENIRLALPPLRQQKVFAMQSAKVYELRGRHVESNKMEETLFSSLQHRAFTGEL